MTILQGILPGVSQYILKGVLASGAFISLVNNGKLSPLFTFTRASSQTYIDSDGLLKEVGTDVPAIDYSQGFAGLSLWEGSTNLVGDGDEIETWTPTNVSRVLDGSETITNFKNAALVTADATNAIHILVSPTNNSFTSGTTYTFSTYAKAGTTSRFQMSATSAAFGTAQYANFSLTGAGSVLASAGGTVRIEKVGTNGWYRCSFTLTATTTASGTSLAIGFIDSDTATRFPAFAGSGESIYLFGAQTEPKPYPTPYIRTSGATASRAAPSVSITGTNFNFFNAVEGTFLLDYLQPFDLNNFERLWQLVGSTINDRIDVELTSDKTRVAVRDNNVIQAALDTDGNQFGVRKKVVAAFKEDDFAVIDTGGTIKTDTSGSLPSMESFYLGQSSTGSGRNNMYIASLRYYPKRLTNAKMEDLVA